jgi:CopG-like RHH_1 or ribbon-helix-helix domain, RHH_5
MRISRRRPRPRNAWLEQRNHRTSGPASAPNTPFPRSWFRYAAGNRSCLEPDWCMMWCMKRTNIYLAEGQAAALDRAAEAEGVSRAELIRGLIDRAIGGHPGADLAADLAAINSSFGVLAGQEEAFSRARDQRMDYLDRLADA